MRIFWWWSLLAFWSPATQLAFYVNLNRAVIGPSATLTGRWRPDIDLCRLLTGYTTVRFVSLLRVYRLPTLLSAFFLFVFLYHSRLLLSRLCLSRITAYLEVKIWSLFKQGNLITSNKYIVEKRRNFSSFPKYFQYISNFRSQVTYFFVKCGCSIYFFLQFCKSDMSRYAYLVVF